METALRALSSRVSPLALPPLLAAARSRPHRSPAPRAGFSVPAGGTGGGSGRRHRLAADHPDGARRLRRSPPPPSLARRAAWPLVGGASSSPLRSRPGCGPGASPRRQRLPRRPRIRRLSLRADGGFPPGGDPRGAGCRRGDSARARAGDDRRRPGRFPGAYREIPPRSASGRRRRRRGEGRPRASRGRSAADRERRSTRAVARPRARVRQPQRRAAR